MGEQERADEEARRGDGKAGFKAYAREHPGAFSGLAEAVKRARGDQLASVSKIIAPAVDTAALTVANSVSSVVDTSTITNTVRKVVERLPPLDSVSPFNEEFYALLQKAQEALVERYRKWENRARRTQSADFKDNPEACERYKAFFESTGLNKGGFAKRLDIKPQTASKYIKNPECMSEYAAYRLEEWIGEKAYYDMLHGEGAYSKQVATKKAAEAKQRLYEYLDKLSPERALQEIEFFFRLRTAVEESFPERNQISTNTPTQPKN